MEKKIEIRLVDEIDLQDVVTAGVDPAQKNSKPDHEACRGI